MSVDQVIQAINRRTNKIIPIVSISMMVFLLGLRLFLWGPWITYLAVYYAIGLVYAVMSVGLALYMHFNKEKKYKKLFISHLASIGIVIGCMFIIPPNMVIFCCAEFR
jgi:hypothetical protein